METTDSRLVYLLKKCSNPATLPKLHALITEAFEYGYQCACEDEGGGVANHDVRLANIVAICTEIVKTNSAIDLHNVLRKWLDIKESEGYNIDHNRARLVDIAHSSLLDRIIKGKEIFPDPPPRAYAYPWYKLIENGTAVLAHYEVFFENHFDNPMVGICQSLWKITDNPNQDQYIITYLMGHNDKERWSDSRWLLEKGKEVAWVLTKI